MDIISNIQYMVSKLTTFGKFTLREHAYMTTKFLHKRKREHG